MNDSTSQLPPGVDPDVTTSAQLYSFLLNGERTRFSNRTVQVADGLEAIVPEARDAAQNQRIFVRRATRRMVGEFGITQIIDLGSGLPTDRNTHEVAHEINPNVRVVYTDFDALTTAEAKQRLDGTDNVEFIPYDVRDSKGLLSHPTVQALIDFDQPVGLIMGGLIHLISDDDDPEQPEPRYANSHDLVRQYIDSVPSGSYLALSHFTHEGNEPHKVKAFVDATQAGNEPIYFRSTEEITRYFDGLEMVIPYAGSEEVDLVWSNRWWAKDPARADQTGAWIRVAVGKKP